MWYVVCDMWYVVCDMWYVVCGMWVCGMWYVVCGMWYVVCALAYGGGIHVADLGGGAAVASKGVCTLTATVASAPPTCATISW